MFTTAYLWSVSSTVNRLYTQYFLFQPHFNILLSTPTLSKRFLPFIPFNLKFLCFNLFSIRRSRSAHLIHLQLVTQLYLLKSAFYKAPNFCFIILQKDNRSLLARNLGALLCTQKLPTVTYLTQKKVQSTFSYQVF